MKASVKERKLKQLAAMMIELGIEMVDVVGGQTIDITRDKGKPGTGKFRQATIKASVPDEWADALMQSLFVGRPIKYRLKIIAIPVGDK